MARILGFFLRIDHSFHTPPKTIAICKFIGLGSIIQATPLLRTLRKKHPNARIVFITNFGNKDLLKHITDVDEVYTISDKGIINLLKSTLILLFKLWKQRPEIYIDLEIYSNYSNIIATMSLSKNRMGFFKDDKTYRKGIYTHMLFFNIKAPISQAYLQFTRLLDCKNISAEPFLNRKTIDNNIMPIINKKLNIVNGEKYILVNPNASDLRIERRWEIEKFSLLINRIANTFPEYKIVLMGDKTEVEYVNKIYSFSNTNPNVLDSSGKLSLSELIILIANAELMITNDTGPMHIAFALKTQTVSLFGPCSPQQYGGLGNTITIYKNVYCSPCVHDFLIPPCNGDNQCMKKITVEEVYYAVELSLNNISKESANLYPEIDYTNSDQSPLGVVLRQK